ncbi:flagellar hook-associated protein 1 FlgK [Anaerosolibacter carboniphilus]|uniref:Flagellar hook-associated protein 1 n=1 Tax=Anaerosolibacter carboniphilus TaxID=1417629 RepID=A0A841KSN4_9FIRM|nr:flagellar hook-associated protein FlgK [Anaerosolibacter carboniphilus]MBB6216411.1 flagellar hook-associated protein 1 FlgK [Anaerosolibacter carboniphilus]
MRSTFFGLNTSVSGLFASQRALDVTGHNISNANTPGYSRQRLNVTQSLALTLPNGQGMIGTGVDTRNIQQLRDKFLDYKYWQENTTLGKWTTRADSLEQIEAILNEPSDSGIQTVMDEFYSALQELSQGEKADNLTVRTQVRERGIALTKTLNHMYSQLQNMQKNMDFEVQTTVDQINGYAKQIANLNKQIFQYELDGSNANDLRDQRNLLVDQLSELVDIEVQESADGRFKVAVNGISLVSHYDCQQLKVEKRTTEKNPGVDNKGLLEVKWENGTSFNCKSGKLQGVLDTRDNIDGNTKGIPYYMDQLNRFTTVFAARFNLQHSQGAALDGSTGINFFNGPTVAEITDPIDPTWTDAQIISNFEEAGTVVFKADGKWYKATTITAADINISDDIAGNDGLNKIAAAASPLTGPGDGSNALLLLNMRHDTGMFSWGSPDDFFKSLISNLGVDSQEAIRMMDNQNVLVNQIENSRQSVSGVSMDEEMANMVKFQHAYNAAARMITTIDEMLDKIINGMGMVGR